CDSVAYSGQEIYTLSLTYDDLRLQYGRQEALARLGPNVDDPELMGAFTRAVTRINPVEAPGPVIADQN
ncbi:hypothetical protein ABTL69_19460, partial [Acinetobacter baumannii]